jgi:hypothetical protein
MDIFEKREHRLLLEDGMLLLDGEAQGQKYLTLGRQPALLAFFDSIERQGRDARQAGELRFAEHFGFAHLPNVVPIIHRSKPSVGDLEARDKVPFFYPIDPSKSTKIKRN